MAACNITTCLIASEFGKKRQSGKQNKTSTCTARQVMFLAESLQCNSASANSPLLNIVPGQVEVQPGQVNFRGSLPGLASHLLEPMLHPE